MPAWITIPKPCLVRSSSDFFLPSNSLYIFYDTCFRLEHKFYAPKEYFKTTTIALNAEELAEIPSLIPMGEEEEECCLDKDDDMPPLEDYRIPSKHHVSFSTCSLCYIRAKL